VGREQPRGQNDLGDPSQRARHGKVPFRRLGARLENAFDRFYELAHGYNTPGLSVFLEIVWQPASR